LIRFTRDDGFDKRAFETTSSLHGDGKSSVLPDMHRLA
jgi:hypothetical protein